MAKVELESGGSISMELEVDLFALSVEDREWLFKLIDAFQAYERTRGPIADQIAESDPTPAIEEPKGQPVPVPELAPAPRKAKARSVGSFQAIREILTKATHPLSVDEVVIALNHKQNHKQVRDALYHLKSKGQAVKEGDGYLAQGQSAPDPADEPEQGSSEPTVEEAEPINAAPAEELFVPEAAPDIEPTENAIAQALPRPKPGLICEAPGCLRSAQRVVPGYVGSQLITTMNLCKRHITERFTNPRSTAYGLTLQKAEAFHASFASQRG